VTRMRRTAIAPLWLAASMTAAASAQDVTPGRLVMLRQMSDPQLSRDGSLAVYTVYSMADSISGGEESHLWIKATRTAEPPKLLAAASEGDERARFSPVSNDIAFLSDRPHGGGAPEGSTQVYVASPEAGDARRVTAAPKGVQRFVWSPDGRSIAYVTADSVPAPSRYPHSDAMVAGRYTQNELWVADVATGSATRLTDRQFDVREIAFSPDASELAAIIAPTPLSPDREMRLVVLTRSTGRIARTLDDHIRGVTRVLKWSPDGKWITYFQDTPDRRGFWLAAAPAAGGAPVPVLRDFPGTVMQADWSREPNHLKLVLLEGLKSHIADVDIRTSRFTDIADVNTSQSSWGFSSNGSAVLYMSETPASTADLWFAEGGRGARLTKLNPEVGTWRLGTVTTVRWRNHRDGRELDGVLILPVGYLPGRRYPAIVHMHPGDLPWWPGWIGSWYAWGQLLATHGYVVFLPNYRGVNGYGWQGRATLDDWGGAAMDDMLDGVDMLVAKGIADPDRLGIGGWSNGGFMTEWTIGHTTRFRAAVAEAAHADWFAMYSAPGGAWTDIKALYGADPFTDRAPYDAHSPIMFVRNVTTPTLLLHGQNDGAVPVTQSWEYYQGLRSRGVETELVVFPNAGHGLSRPAHRTEVQARMLEWFDAHLKK